MRISKLQESQNRFSQLLDQESLDEKDLKEFESLFKMLMAEVNKATLNVDCIFLLSRACSRSNDKDHQFELFFLDRVLMLQNDYFVALVRRAEIYYDLGRYAEAFQNLIDSERVSLDKNELRATTHYQSLVQLRDNLWRNPQGLSEISEMLSSANIDRQLELDIVRSQKMTAELEAETIAELTETVKEYRDLALLNDPQNLKQRIVSLSEENLRLKRSMLEISVKLSLLFSENTNTLHTYSFQQWIALGQFLSSHDQGNSNISSLQILSELFIEDMLYKYMLIIFARLKDCLYFKRNNTERVIAELFIGIKETFSHFITLFSYLTQPSFDVQKLELFYSYVVSYQGDSVDSLVVHEEWLAKLYVMVSKLLFGILLKCLELERLSGILSSAPLLTYDSIYNIKVVVNHIIAPLRKRVDHDEYSKTVKKYSNIKIDAISFFNFFRVERLRESSKLPSKRLGFFSKIDEDQKVILDENYEKLTSDCLIDNDLYPSKALDKFKSKFGDEQSFWQSDHLDVDQSNGRGVK